MKNAGKACNNRLYRHIRTFEKIIKNYFVIYDEITRKDTAELVKAAGFDIETSAQWLQEFYLKRYWDETRKNG